MYTFPIPPNTALPNGRWLSWSECTVRLGQGAPDLDKLYGGIGRMDGNRWVGEAGTSDDRHVLAPLLAKEAGVPFQGLGTYLARTAAENWPLRGVQVGRPWGTNAPTGLLKFYHSRPLNGMPYNAKAVDRAVQRCATATLAMDPKRFELWGVVWPNTTPIEVYAYDADHPMPTPVARALDGLEMDMFSIHRDGTITWYAHCAPHERTDRIERMSKSCGVVLKQGIQARLDALEDQGWGSRLVAIQQALDGGLQMGVHLARDPIKGVVVRV